MPKTRGAETPAELYGPLLARVQERGILADGKTFVDAVPLRPIADIMADFAALHGGDSELLRFVVSNFKLPPSIELAAPNMPAQPLRAHIRAMWAILARDPETGAVNSSALPVGHRHVVPGGRFREIYYWDSFFTMLGLVRDGEIALATGIVDAMTDLIEDHGHIPNGTRTYYLGRSQPPLFHMMVALLDDPDPQVAARRLVAMKREHAWWMDGAGDLTPGARVNHVAMLPDGSVLNRYWDPRGTPRDESWREDVETAVGSGRPPEQVYQDLRAGAESGWDFSSRWLDDEFLSSIRTTAIAPVDLNAFLYGLETAIAASGDADAARYAEHARLRRDAMHKHLWNEREGYFADYDLERGSIRPSASAAALAPLLAGLASQHQADATARFTQDKLLAPGGLRTTLVDSGQQWDSPNGWAPLQWIAIAGLRRYGHDALAGDIASRWIATVDATYVRTGMLYEKYDVETSAVGHGGEYAPQIGFGWTNGVTADLIDERDTRPGVTSS
ncbi:alpha,alpha-trehalase TreF [Sphingomonas sp. MG17]|uniref:Alpha,alpha-trehalase TreF n=1 Tax=Sphingomonas tagetis TaxID=2949092 RepID=A0A9X2KL23_9SPHN|nr:alpha,alpha-trehalase TreF [Sphingomonas tagetis]MCP3731124.1 alpha,alpha-trehalase TreF [Sphingomonas tagetis]